VERLGFGSRSNIRRKVGRPLVEAGDYGSSVTPKAETAWYCKKGELNSKRQRVCLLTRKVKTSVPEWRVQIKKSVKIYGGNKE